MDVLKSDMEMKVQSKEAVIERIQGAAAQLQALGVRRIALFGSFVREEPRADSDVDLLVEFAQDRLGFDAFMDTAFLLESLLGRRVELVTPEALNRHLGPHILREVEDVLIAA
jgi:hypothetical protein